VSPAPSASIEPDDADLPPRPERPDCCFGGCAICVLDAYQDELARWEAQVEEIQKQRRAANPVA
jgi:hypothetical protein